MNIAVFVLVSIVVCLLGYVVGRIGTRSTNSNDSTQVTTRFRKLVAFWTGVSVVTLVGVTNATETPEAVSAALTPIVPAVIGVIFGWLLVVPVVVLATTSTYYGGFPTLARARDSPLDRTTATLGAARTVGIHALIFGLPVTLAVTAADFGFNFGVVAVVIAGIPIGSYLGSPMLVSLSVSARKPNDAERRRLFEVATTVDLPDMTWQIVQGAFGADSEVAIVGPVGFRRLYVSKQFFDNSATAFESALAIQSERERLSYRAVAAVVLSLKVLVGGILIGFLLKLLPVRPTPPNVALGLPIGIITVVILDWLCWRAMYRADERAANRVGIEQLCDSLQELTEQNDAVEDPSRLVQHLRSRPSLSRRLSKVRNKD